MADWAAVRRSFDAAERWTYLDTASTGPLPAGAVAAGRDFLTDAAANARSPDLWREGLDRARQGFARLIGAADDEVAFTKNATEGVNIVAAGLGAEAGDNVVLCGAREHPANITPWLALRRAGVEVRLVAPDRQAIPAVAVAAAIDRRTRAVALSTVTFMPGFRTDLEPIVEAARRLDALVIVDATQSAGVLATDVRAMGVDALVTSTHKYLLGLYGQGFLYLAPCAAERLAPVFVGAAGYRDPTAHPAAAAFAWEPAAGARRFETGHAFASSAIV
ncbi:MAG: aminotransferase class V-fold PLP-dependent enzyme, partial [Alphaproteobacteria bacterium]